MAQIRTPPGGTNTPFGGVGLKRGNPTGPGQSGKSRRIEPGEAVPDTIDDLIAVSVQSTSELTKPAITQVHNILANDVQSASGLSIPVLRQVHAILANDVQSASSVSVPALTVVRNLLANDVESASSVSVPMLRQVHALLANDVQSASSVSVPSATHIHVLLAADVESASSLSVPALAENGAAGTDVLLAEDVEAATQLSRPVLTVVSAPVEDPPISGPAYSPNAKAAMEVYRILFGKRDEKKAVKKRKRLRRVEKAALDLLNDFRPEEYQPIDLTALNLALKGLDKKFVPKQDAKPSEKLQIIQTLIEEAERLRREIEQDDEEILLILAA